MTSAPAAAGEEVWIDPWRASTAGVLLISVVLAAAWLPARRAGRIEPAQALKAQ
jgi:ABC-type lipoprotein release transport system permease subunit